MNVQDLKSIVNNMDAKDELPVCVRVKFSDKQKSDTIIEVENFHQYSDNFLFNVIVDVDYITDDVVIERLMKFRYWLTERTKHYSKNTKAEINGEEASDSSLTNGLTQAYTNTLAKFEELFCRTLEDGSTGNS